MVIKSCPLLMKDTETCVGSSLASYFVLFSLILFCFRWFRFVSFSFRWFRFLSFRFCWFRFVFVDFVSFRFVSFLFRFALYRYLNYLVKVPLRKLATMLLLSASYFHPRNFQNTQQFPLKNDALWNIFLLLTNKYFQKTTEMKIVWLFGMFHNSFRNCPVHEIIWNVCVFNCSFFIQFLNFI